MNPCILWDAAKAVLREKIIARTAALEKIQAQNSLTLQGHLTDLEQAHIVNKESSSVQQIRNVKPEIDKILSEEVKKNIRFMKQRYYEAGSSRIISSEAHQTTRK